MVNAEYIPWLNRNSVNIRILSHNKWKIIISICLSKHFCEFVHSWFVYHPCVNITNLSTNLLCFFAQIFPTNFPSCSLKFIKNFNSIYTMLWAHLWIKSIPIMMSSFFDICPIDDNRIRFFDLVVLLCSQTYLFYSRLPLQNSTILSRIFFTCTRFPKTIQIYTHSAFTFFLFSCNLIARLIDLSALSWWWNVFENSWWFGSCIGHVISCVAEQHTRSIVYVLLWFIIRNDLCI